MGYEKKKRRLLLTEGVREPVNALTGASTGTTISNRGITRIVVGSTEGTGETISGATGTNLSFTMEHPINGARATLVIDNNSTKIVQVRLSPSSAAGLIFGSTKNALRWSTGSTDLPAHVDLLGLSTSQWAIVNISSTSIAVAGSTY
jgi:hypothetical protein